MSKLISPDVLHANLSGPNPPVIIDVRDAHDFHEAHIVGAQHIPFDSIEPARHQLPMDRMIVTY